MAMVAFRWPLTTPGNGHSADNKLGVVVIDDVLTAGTALRESLDKLTDAINVLGAVISVDREEPHPSAGTNRAALPAN